MTMSIAELAQAREVVTQIFDALDLDAYLFEVEPCDDRWEIKLECAVAEGWETVRLSAAKENLLRGVDDAAARQLLLDDWRKALSACLTKSLEQ
ncbi:MAG: hypothetical protein JSW10_07835 [Pseudomonadota bacterium]|nr:MAG: hypothetical protein JSW10_07835 [Pseudomonadota bacterium]